LVWGVVVPGVGEGGLPVLGYSGVGIGARWSRERGVCYIALVVVSLIFWLWFGD
jgi:hypothetical protein